MSTRKQHSKDKGLPAFSELVDDRCRAFESDVQVDFIMRNEILKHTVEEASSQVGISASYGYKIRKDWRENPKFRSRIFKKLKQYPADYQDACKALLPAVLDTEVRAVKAMQDDPTLAVKHPQLLKQIKQGAGIDLNESPVLQPQLINIETMQVIQQMIASDIKKRCRNPEVVEAEVIEPEK